MRKTFRIITIAIVAVFSGALILEMVSHLCPKIKASEIYPRKTCVEVVAEYAPGLQSRLLHEELTVDEVLENRTLYVSLEDLGANGTACFRYATLVNKELPPRARRYVAIHEAIHFLGELDETKANFQAALREPVGLIETILYSLEQNLKILAKKPLSSYPCIFGRLWIIFKVYFLGGNFERYVDAEH